MSFACVSCREGRGLGNSAGRWTAGGASPRTRIDSSLVGGCRIPNKAGRLACERVTTAPPTNSFTDDLWPFPAWLTWGGLGLSVAVIGYAVWGWMR